MRLAIVQILLLISAVSWAGGEVPWPKEDQQDVNIREMGGLWVSQHIDAPQRTFYFNLERGSISDACPYVLRAFEVDSATNKLITAGGGVFCSGDLDALTIVMYDFTGHARNYLQIVGVKKPAQADFIGVQMLGMTLSTYELHPLMIVQDTFYLLSK